MAGAHPETGTWPPVGGTAEPTISLPDIAIRAVDAKPWPALQELR